MCLKKDVLNMEPIVMNFISDLFFGSKCINYYQNYFISLSLSSFNEMAILSNVHKPDNSESHNSIKCSFNNF